MPDPDFFGFFKFQPGPVTQTVKILTLEGETLKIESTLPKKAEFFIQCPNDVMPDPDFFGMFKFQPGPVTQTVKILTYGELMAKLRRNHGENMAKLWRNYGEIMAELTS